MKKLTKEEFFLLISLCILAIEGLVRKGEYYGFITGLNLGIAVGAIILGDSRDKT